MDILTVIELNKRMDERAENCKVQLETKRIEDGVYLWYVIKRDTNIRIKYDTFIIWIDYSIALDYAEAQSRITGNEYIPISIYDYNVMFKRFMEWLKWIKET